MQPPWSLCRRCSLRGVSVDDAASVESLSTMQPPWSLCRRCSLRGVSVDDAASVESLSTMQPPWSLCRRCSLRGVSVDKIGSLAVSRHVLLAVTGDMFIYCIDSIVSAQVHVSESNLPRTAKSVSLWNALTRPVNNLVFLCSQC